MANNEKTDRYLVLLEQIQGQVQLLAEAHEHSDTKIEALRLDMSSMGERLEHRLDSVDLRLKRIDQRFDHLENRVDRTYPRYS